MLPQTLVFFGIAGSGKGTQMKLLIDFLKSHDGRESIYAYPGNEYRELIKRDTFTGNTVKESMAKGELQPDFLTTTIITNILVSTLTEDKHLVVDGYPRTLSQSASFEDMMKFYRRDDIKIVYIEVGKKEAMKRNLARGRQDDTVEGIEKRFDEYVKNVVPSMHHFQKKKGYTIYAINGEQSVENVNKDILKALNF